MHTQDTEVSPRVTTLVSLLHQLETQEDYASSNGQTQSRRTILSMGLKKKISHENYCQCFLICPHHSDIQYIQVSLNNTYFLDSYF